MTAEVRVEVDSVSPDFGTSGTGGPLPGRWRVAQEMLRWAGPAARGPIDREAAVQIAEGQEP